MRSTVVTCALLSGVLAAFGQNFARPGLLPPKSQWPPDVAEHFALAGDVLASALETRAAAISDFKIPELNVGWKLRILKLDDDTVIFSYTPPAGFRFDVQTVACESQSKFLDYTMLGPTEKAADFYDANVSFLISGWDANDVRCAGETHLTGSLALQDTEIPNVKYVTSESRVIRHLCYWLRYFEEGAGKDPARAADFYVTALDKERAHLVDLESSKEYADVARNLALFDKQFPDDGFTSPPLLDAAGRAHVRAYLENSIRLRSKLKPFIPDADARIRQDEALLVRFR